MMHRRHTLCLGILVALVLLAGAVVAQVNPFTNPSFEAVNTVTGEAITLNGTTGSSFAHSRVIPSSVVVESQDGSITYNHATDYSLHTGQSISRRDSSTIPDGAMVLVSYNYSKPLDEQGWTTYGYTVPGEGGAEAPPNVGPTGSQGTFDVLLPNQGPADGEAIVGYQGWGDARNGGVYQTFVSPGRGWVLISARAYSLNWEFQPSDIGNRVRAGVVSGTATDRTAVVSWYPVTWGTGAGAGGWSDIKVFVATAGTYTLFIENHLAWGSGIWSSFWDNVRWSDGVIEITGGPTVTSVSETEATIEWDTDVISTTKLYYDMDDGAPYAYSATGASDAHHVVHLTGLTPGTTYHFSVESKDVAVPPRLTMATSTDATFLTVATVQPQLNNGDFEAVDAGNQPTLAPWTKFGMFDGLRNNFDYGVPARSESHFAGAIASSGTEKSMSGCFQRVAVTPGETYSATAWIWTENDVGTQELYVPGPASDVSGRVGIDPTGGMDSTSPTVVWGPWDSSQDWQAPYTQLGYRQVGVGVRIPETSTVATVFLQVFHRWGNAWLRNAFDDVEFGLAAPATNAGEAKTKPLGWFVDMNNGGEGILVTKAELIEEGNPTDLIAYCWVQDDSRAAGLKVRLDGLSWDMQDSITRGCRIRLAGNTTRRDLRDFYCGDTEIVASPDGTEIISTGNDDPKPIAMTNAALAGASAGVARGATGAYGANNVGLLVKTTGRVVGQGVYLGFGVPYYFFIDDGSGLDNPMNDYGNLKGIKVWDPNWEGWATMPDIGAMVEVTGVSCLEVYDPTPIDPTNIYSMPDGSGDEVLMRTIRMRDGLDLRTIKR